MLTGIIHKVQEVDAKSNEEEKIGKRGMMLKEEKWRIFFVLQYRDKRNKKENR